MFVCRDLVRTAESKTTSANMARGRPGLHGKRLEVAGYGQSTLLEKFSAPMKYRKLSSRILMRLWVPGLLAVRS